MQPFQEGDLVQVVAPRDSLHAKVGDTALVERCYRVGSYPKWYLDLKWVSFDGARPIYRGCYAEQFSYPRGPW